MILVPVYFIRHPADATPPTPSLQRLRRGIPGRYPLPVRCTTLQRAGERFEARPDQRRDVLVDAFGPGILGSNMDPMVLSEKLPWFLSFCHAKQWAPAVPVGAVVAMGWTTTRLLMIDTVLVVSKKATIPAFDDPGGRRSILDLEHEYPRYRDQFPVELASVEWAQFTATREFYLNLADSMTSTSRRETAHEYTQVKPHVQLVGTLGAAPPSIAASELLAQFASGRGFDFIPRRASRPKGKCKALDVRPSTFACSLPFVGEIAASESPVVRLEDERAFSLLRAVFSKADELILGRLLPDVVWPPFTTFAALERAMAMKRLEDLGFGRATVGELPTDLADRAETIAKELQLPLGGPTCGDNSFVLASAILEEGREADVVLVLGFAFASADPEVSKVPSAHVWVRAGGAHYDITWEKRDQTDRVYFVAAEMEVARGAHRRVLQIAEERGIKCF